MKFRISIGIVFTLLLLTSFVNKPIDGEWVTIQKEELSAAIDKAAGWFLTNKNYKVKVNYSTYLNHTTAVVYEKSNGFFKRSNNNFSTAAMSVSTVQNDKMQFVVDSINQIIIVNNKTDFNQSPFDSKGFLKLLENVKSIKKKNISTELIVYKVEFKPNGLYSQYEAVINTKGLFQTVKYYYSTELSKEEEDGTTKKGTPRLEINYSDYQMNVSFDYEKEFSEKKYFRDLNGKVVLNEKFKDYELKDYRFVQKK